MSRGGKRPGAGRTPGRLNKRTVARLQLTATAAEQGITPLDVMIKCMRFHNAIADLELEKGVGADQSKISQALQAAREAAKEAAPYLHPRLAAVQHTGKVEGEVSVIHRLLKEIEGTTSVLPPHCLNNSNPSQPGGADPLTESDLTIVSSSVVDKIK